VIQPLNNIDHSEVIFKVNLNQNQNPQFPILVITQEDHLNKRIENSLQRIDDKFLKLNNNLKKYQDIMGPAKNEL
jgi:hypothetical protein